jgi:hypothetical protein
MTPPLKIKFRSDDSELELIQVIPPRGKGVVTYLRYKYTKSFTYQGQTVMFSDDDVYKMIKNKTLIII